MKKLLNNEHFRSFIHTFWTDLLWEASVSSAVAHIFLQQDFSRTALLALGYAVFRTLLRLIRTTYFKKPAYAPQEDLPNAP